MSQHAIYAPSSAKRWIPCSASAPGIAALPAAVTESGDEAEEGTEAHNEIDRLLGHMNGLIKPERFAMPVQNYEHPAAYGIGLFLSYVTQLPTGRIWVEQKVTLTKDIWGRCDVAHWHEESGTLTIVDYKNGYLDVQAEENEQELIYAAAVCATFKISPKWIRLVVVQPNSFMPVPRVKQWITTAAYLQAFAARVSAIPSAPLVFVAGQEQCRDCPLFGLCPPTKDLLLHFGTVMGKPAVEVPPEKIALYKSLEKPIEHFFKALHKHGQKMALSGNVPSGMKLVTATKHRDWKPDRVEELKARMAAAHGVTVLELPTPAQAEDRGLVTADELALCAVRPEGGPALAFESDKRPAWTPRSTEQMFGSVVNAKV